MNKLLCFSCIFLGCIGESYTMRMHENDINMIGAEARIEEAGHQVDIDLTELNKSHFELMANRVSKLSSQQDLDRIPVFGEGDPVSDFQTLRNLKDLITDLILDSKQIFPCKPSDFVSQLFHNCEQMERNIFELPDRDFLYYQVIEGGQQHLFLHLSSRSVQKHERFYHELGSRVIRAHTDDFIIN